jgi:lipopolysaccharide/colanic/teichoic acid biosynthesis glycosyltransferase
MPQIRQAIGIPHVAEFFLAVFGLVAVAPILLGCAVLIKLGSKGPVFFRQKRVGLNGNEFVLLKLRTMSVGSSGSLVTAAGDSRVTSIGRILRIAKIDELPELWNIIRGEMSFVGPRPEVPQYVDITDPIWQEILTHRPGITDPVTLRLRNEEQLLAQVVDKETFYRDVVQPYKLRGYLYFIRNKSWKTDIRIIGRTLRAIAKPHTVAPPTRDEMRLSFVD